MKHLYSIKPHKRKQLIFLLTSFFVLLLLTGLIENRNLQKINQDFFSLYQDRLVPAAQIYELSELMHDKRLTFQLLQDENYRLSLEEISEIKAGNVEILNILQDYEKTYLVAEEEAHLKDFKTNLAIYLKAESEILFHLENDDYEVAKLLINARAKEYAEQVDSDLNQLAKIQPEIGEELMHHYRSSFSSSSALYYFKTALIVVIGVLVIQLLGFSEKISRSIQKFELN